MSARALQPLPFRSLMVELKSEDGSALERRFNPSFPDDDANYVQEFKALGAFFTDVKLRSIGSWFQTQAEGKHATIVYDGRHSELMESGQKLGKPLTAEQLEVSLILK